ncbi:MAG TPA: glycosyltransferase family 39 protein [Candidatus Margulisiibacteriota bacterium]|nr:glycosyltransferase family 39 protein [Candidatus Margulisiibacteriota bacterium]
MKNRAIRNIFILGFLIRLSAGLFIGYEFHSNYAVIARNLAAGKGYRYSGEGFTAHRAPGYPLFLAGMISVFGEKKLPFIFAMALIGAANAALCAKLGKGFFGAESGFLAGLIYIFFPYLAYVEANLESAFVTLGLLTGLILFFKAREDKHPVYLWLCGLSFSYSYLFRPSIAFIPFFLSLVLVFFERGNRKFPARAAGAAMLMLAFFSGILPWGLRNKKVFGRWYFGQTFAWHDLYIGNNKNSLKIYPLISGDKYFGMIPAVPVYFNDEFKEEEWYKEHTLAQLSSLTLAEKINMAALKLTCLWNARLVPYTAYSPDKPGQRPYRKRRLRENLFFSIPYISLIMLSAIGCWRARKRPRLILFMAAFLLFFSLPYTLFFGYSRYATQVYFILIILAGEGLSALLPKTIFDRISALSYT